MGRIVAIIICVFLVGCGRSPVSPTPTPAPTQTPATANISGRWTGRVEGTHPDTGATTYPFEATFEQNGMAITGTWLEPSESPRWLGTITGMLSGAGADAAFSGTATWDSQSSVPGARCHGQAAMNGPAVAPSMVWRGSDLAFQDCSGVLTDVRWLFFRQ